MINSYKNKVERGVSPVVGVILMVAVTVILAAVIGSFVLSLGGSVSENATASVSFDSEASGQIDTTDNGSDDPDTTEYTVDIQLTNLGTADKIKIKAIDTDNTQDETENPDSVDNSGSDLVDYDPSVGTSTLSDPGEFSTVTQLTEGDEIAIIGVIDGEETNTMQTYTVE